ncbi:MAG: class I SAM-dependent methyltransferase [Clostridia bacterium]|nr:class I SAM-dependent methyltransferase [Clostridia bacterium]
MTASTPKSIDGEVLAGYEAGIEKGRLRTDLGHIEFDRTMEILREFLPPAPAVVCDIGGAYGEYAWPLAALGYETHLFDLSPANIRMSAELAAEWPGVALAAAETADARSIGRPDGFADAILFMGPMYHITERHERQAALAECRRLLKPGGRLFTGAISRYATALWATTVFGAKNDLLAEPAFQGMIEREIATGHHIRPEDSAYHGIGRSYFHLPRELAEELAEAGFSGNDVRGILGGGWLAPDLDGVWQDPVRRGAVMRIVRLMEKEESLLGLSTHLLAISEKPGRGNG